MTREREAAIINAVLDGDVNAYEILVKEYEKVKSKTSPKAFAKAHIIYNKTRYDNSTQFFEDYYGGDCKGLVAAIREYKRIRRSHRKDELYLADILK